MLCTLCVGQASALEYTMEAPDDYLFGRPTSDDTIYEWEDPNVDRSKNTALIPPGVTWTAAATVAADMAVSGVLMKVTGNRDCLRWYQKRAEKAREGG